MTALIDRIDALVATVEAELALAPSVRTSGADDAQLALARDALKNMKRSIESGSRPSRVDSYPNLGRMVTDSWNFMSPLGRDLVEVEQLYRQSFPDEEN